MGADFPNEGGPSGRFEIEMCRPREPIQLYSEPTNPVDPRAVKVVSTRGIQIGYLTADRCGWVGSMLAAGDDLQAIFQEKTPYGALIRISLDANAPDLPPERIAPDLEPDWWPDEIPPDD